MTAAIALFLANLPALISAGTSLAKYIQDFVAAAKQSGEWTADHQAQFNATLANAWMQSEWKLDQAVLGIKV